MSVYVKNDSGHLVMFERVRNRWGRPGFWRYRCTCGKTSRLFLFQQSAEDAGRAHANLKGGWAGAWQEVSP